jgi:hypothetical protein
MCVHVILRKKWEWESNKVELCNKKLMVKISGQWLFRELNLSFSAPRKHYQSLHFPPVLPISLKNEQYGK